MKVNRKTIYLVLITLCMICSISENRAQNTMNKPMFDKINQAAQIPEKEISTLSTRIILQEYLKSRYVTYFFLYDNIHDALLRQYEDYNGLRELLNREDAVDTILEYYQNMDPNAYNISWELSKQGSFSLSFIYIELLISHENILNKLNKSQTRLLLTELLKKNERNDSHPEVFSRLGVIFNTYAIAKVLYSKGAGESVSQDLIQTEGISILLETGKLSNEEVRKLVCKKAKEYLINN